MFKKIIAVSTLLVASTIANAAIIEQTITLDPTATNFEKTVSFNKFDDLGGTIKLESVMISLDGLVQGSAGVENLSGSASKIVVNLEVELSLTGPLGRLLATSVPSDERIFNALAFDGVVDFLGDSGTEFNDLAASEFVSTTLSDAPTLTFFTGMGLADFNFDAVATSSVTGAGGIISQLNTNAGGTFRLVYEYSDVVKEVSAPTSIALMGLALIALASTRRLSK